MSFRKRALEKICSTFGYSIYDRKELKKEYSRWCSIEKKYMLSVNVCVDVGVGRGTSEMYETVSFDKLILVEPLEIYKDQIENIKKRWNSEWIRVAASNSNGRRKITFNKKNPEKSSFLNRKKRFKRRGSKKQMKIEKKRLDKLLNIEEKSTFGIKIDTEGHDLKVLRGCEGILKKTKFVVVETPIIDRFENSYSMDRITEYMSDKEFYIAGVVGMDADTPVKFIDFVFFNRSFV